MPLREVWRHEALDFTKWLELNPDVLSDALGIDITNIERERSTGNFNVDLVGEDASTPSCLASSEPCRGRGGPCRRGCEIHPQRRKDRWTGPQSQDADWVDLTGTPAPPAKPDDDRDDDSDGIGREGVRAGGAAADDGGDGEEEVPTPPKRQRPNAIFVRHGKNKKPRITSPGSLARTVSRLATNDESIGYITFEHDDLTAKATDLFRELIGFGILKVSVSDD